jgi:DNA-binding NarL/FixJ family response regulator
MQSPKPVHIFIAENDRIFVRLLDYVFTKDLRYRFLDFKTGEDSLKNLALEPAIIVLDYKLPGMNGVETMLELREQYGEGRVIMLSSPEDKKLPAEFLNAGADEHVLKDGTEIEKLSQLIDSFLVEADQPASRERRAASGWLSKKIYYALIALAALISLGYYWYM